MNYRDFIKSKKTYATQCGIDVDECEINPLAFDWQRKVIQWSLRTGRGALFERHLRESGSLVGIGQFRPENGGYCGRFKVEKIEWEQA